MRASHGPTAPHCGRYSAAAQPPPSGAEDSASSADKEAAGSQGASAAAHEAQEALERVREELRRARADADALVRVKDAEIATLREERERLRDSPPNPQ